MSDESASLVLETRHPRRIPNSLAENLAWVLMALLAVAVASYAAAIVLLPSLRSELVRALFAERPVVAVMHFMGGSLALLAGAMQANASLRLRFISLHRWVGRVYVIAIAGGAVAGFVLALHSSAGNVARSGFALLAVCWFITTLVAYRSIRQRNVAAHRRWMIRSYALTLAAVTLRIYLPASQLAGWSMALAYPAIAWLCWVPNLLVAEWWLVRKHGPRPYTGAIDSEFLEGGVRRA